VTPEVIVQLGARSGATVATCASNLPRAYVVGVEVDAESVELARLNVAPFGGRVLIIHAGAAATDGELCYRHSNAAVRTLTLDSILDEAGVDGDVDFLNIDIGGAEKEVLRCGGEWVSRVRCLKVELHGNYTVDEAIEDVRELGFVAHVDEKHRGCVVAFARSEQLLLAA